MITIASTFVAEPLEVPLSWLLRAAGIRESICFAAYNQVFQELLTPTSLLRRNSAGVNVILVRIEDFVRDLPDRAARAQTVDNLVKELRAAIEDFATETKLPIILAAFAPSPAVPTDLVGPLLAAREALLASARKFPKVHIIEDREVIDAGSQRLYDSVRDQLAHIPYTEEYYCWLSLATARAIHAAGNIPPKVLVLDCDNTLWRGVVGEDGVDGIQITSPYLQLQDFALEQQRKGVLICLVSKNIESDVLSVLEARSDMHLKQEHVVLHRINWIDKPANIRSLAEELNLGLDSFVFLDDNPMECAQMRAELPEVITIQVPAESDFSEFLQNLWMFDKPNVTAEDASRTQMYRENVARRAIERSANDIEQFIAALGMQIDIAIPTLEEWPRLEQLTQRTNQFNFTTRRRSAVELKSLMDDGTSIFRVRVSDRFGDYGIVGLVVAQASGAVLRIDTFLLSCRVLGRGVEHAMLSRLGELAQSAGLEQVSLLHVPTTRNIPARAFADSVAAQYMIASDSGGRDYFMPSAFAAKVEHRPGHDPAEVIAALQAGEKSTPTLSSSDTSARSDRYSRIANKFRSGASVMAEMAETVEQARRARSSEVAATAPTSPVEMHLTQLWQSLLNIDAVGIDDNFFDLGGTSLLSVTLFAHIARQFDAHLPLSAIVEAPTIRALARLIGAPNPVGREGVVCLRAGGSENLFLVHDGLGETLLYYNLAKRLPPRVSVYGIEPKHLPGIPLASTSIQSMAKSYVEQIRKIQPSGPYLLGGMCAGGVIAYEMAACLMSSGGLVRLVVILDGATPRAQKKIGLAGQQRASRLREAIAQRITLHRSPVARWLSIGSVLARKTLNAASYKLWSALHSVSVRWRVVLMKRLVERGAPWPKLLAPLSVMEVYGILESQYSPPTLAEVPVLLVRASSGEGADTPYKDMFSDDDLGWGRVAGRLERVDVTGGHSSMLQEHAVDSLASALGQHLICLNH